MSDKAAAAARLKKETEAKAVVAAAKKKARLAEKARIEAGPSAPELPHLRRHATSARDRLIASQRCAFIGLRTFHTTARSLRLGKSSFFIFRRVFCATEQAGGEKKKKVKKVVVCTRETLVEEAFVACGNVAEVRNVATGWKPMCAACAAICAGGAPPAEDPAPVPTLTPTQAPTHAAAAQAAPAAAASLAAMEEGRSHEERVAVGSVCEAQYKGPPAGS